MGFFLDTLRKLNQLGNPLVRDFTPDAEAEMVQMAWDVAEDDADLVSKYITDPFGRWLDSMGWLDILYGVENYQRNVIDCYNYSAENISKICDQMRSHDRYYGQIIANNWHQSNNVCILLENLVECLNPNSSKYEPARPISDRLFWAGGGDEKVRHETEMAYRSESNKRIITDDDVVEFCSDSDSMELFQSYTDYIFDEAINWNSLDLAFVTAGVVIYKGVEMTLDEAIGLITKEGHSEKLVRKQLDAIISSVISTENSASRFMKDHDTAKQAVEGLIKDYLSDENKNSTFKQFVEAMGGITAVKELVKTSPELIDYLYSDYSQGLEILDNIAQTSDRSGCTEMRAAIERLREDYNSKWTGTLHKVQEFSEETIKSLSQKGIDDWIEEEFGDSSILMTVLDATGLEDKANGYHELLALRKVESELQSAYQEAIAVINSGTYTDADISAAKNLFEMLRETTKTIYETYRDMNTANPSKQIWCNEQISKLEKMGIHGYNSSSLHFESY